MHFVFHCELNTAQPNVYGLIYAGQRHFKMNFDWPRIKMPEGSCVAQITD